MQLAIRGLEESDLTQADSLLQTAFERMVSFLPVLRLHCIVEPAGFWVAEDEGQIIGTVGAVDYRKFAYIALMSVDPRYQRRGIGRQLMDHALEWLAGRGCDVALLDATDKGAMLYETLGFGDDHVAYLFEQETSRPEPPATRGIRLADVGEIEEIVDFDEPLFGANRKKVLHALWDGHRQRCLVARDSESRLTGYMFARDPFLGPWAALDTHAAENLLAAALALPHKHPPQVMVPRSNGQCVDLLNRFGFAERRRLRHMRLGGESPPGQPSCLFGQASFGHG